MRIHVLGRGKVGRTLALSARAQGFDVQLSPGTTKNVKPHPGLTLYVLAVPDAQIRATAERITPHLRPRDVVIHCSGNRGPEELSACREREAYTACVHPMLSFASAKHPPDLTASVWIARGAPKAISAAKKLARAVSAQCIEGPAGRPEYHAAAAMLGNASAALTLVFVQILTSLGLSRRDAERAASGMLHSVASNVSHVGVPAALTGPIRRGDADTVRSHLAGLAQLDPKFAASYRDLAKLTLACAREAGLDPPASARIERELSATYKGKPARRRSR